MMPKFTSEDHERVINDYGACLQDNSAGSFHDLALLPHSKDRIMKALTFGIVHSERHEVINALSVAAITLSTFQPNVGETMILPWASVDLDGMDPREMAALVLTFDNDKLQHLIAVQKEEDDRTLRLIDRAKSLNKMLNPPEPELPKPFWKR